jgi:hypothetical protein
VLFRYPHGHGAPCMTWCCRLLLGELRWCFNGVVCLVVCLSFTE